MQRLLPLCLITLVACASAVCGADPAWTGHAKHRLLIRVDPHGATTRPSDAMPAELEIDWPAQLQAIGLTGQVDLSSLQVVRYDPSTAQPVRFDDYAYQKSRNDRPFCWYDAAIPYDFPEVVGAITRTNGELKRQKSVRAGYVYNTLGDGERGRLAWVHSQDKDQPSFYAVYFDLLPPGQSAQAPPPRGWIGDAMPRCDLVSASTTGSGHTRIALDDWNDDGLIDVVQGEEYGCLFVFPNCGTATQAQFPYRKMIFGTDRLPLDVGMHAAPLVVDWDGDGVKDLLVGTHVNRIVWFRNEGSNRDRKLAYKGFVRIDGKELELPNTPVAGQSSEVFRHDYYPVLDWVDWNGDGRADLLAGGYITGRIFLYENAAQAADGTPKLVFRGPLEADGAPLNVADWCAAPCAADLDGDGRLDLLSGSMPMTPQGRARQAMLRYYRNVGSPSEAKLTEIPLPHRGELPVAGLATPRAADLNGDGLLDLVVSAGNRIYQYPNVGSASEPVFKVDEPLLRLAWGNAPLRGWQFIDFNNDGLPDMVDDYTILLNSGKGSPYSFDKPVPVLPPGVRIAHPSGIGDDWFWPYLCDFDRDGQIDVLFGDWHGTVWLHRNTSSAGNLQFDVDGYRLKTRDGKEIKVGPLDADPSKTFTALQGARTVLTAADFDEDDVIDLVVGDTFGLIRYYRNSGTAKAPVFDPPVVIGDQKIRVLVDATDWNDDGRMDVIAGAANGMVRVYLNTGARGAPATFDAGTDPGLPPIKQPRVVMVDLNRDGDQDLFLPSTQGSVFVERSFLRHGYARGKLLKVEKGGRR